MRLARWFAACSVASACLLLGCAAKTPTITKPPATTRAVAVEDARPRVKLLHQRVQTFAEQTTALPGLNAIEHRDLVRKALQQLAQILPLIEGPNRTLELEEQIKVLNASAAQLADGSSDLSDAPTIYTGVQAAYRALTGLAQRRFANDAEIVKSLAEVHDRLAALDAERGAARQYAVRDTVVKLVPVLKQMTAALESQLGGDAPAPASAPAK